MWGDSGFGLEGKSGFRAYRMALICQCIVDIEVDLWADDDSAERVRTLK